MGADGGLEASESALTEQRKRYVCNRNVILTGKGELTKEQLKSIEDAAVHHTQDAVGAQWSSKKGNFYKEYFYPLCGLRKDSSYCGRILWRDQKAIHAGTLQLDPESMVVAWVLKVHHMTID